MVTRGWPPTTSCAACCSASRWCCASQSRENGFGAPIRRWSPSTARSRQGRSQLSKAAGGTLCDTDSRRRAHRLSNTGSDLTYAQSYPQSEEHTSELQSPCNLVCRLLLEKKKNKKNTIELSFITRCRV